MLDLLNLRSVTRVTRANRTDMRVTAGTTVHTLNIVTPELLIILVLKHE